MLFQVFIYFSLLFLSFFYHVFFFFFFFFFASFSEKATIPSRGLRSNGFVIPCGDSSRRSAGFNQAEETGLSGCSFPGLLAPVILRGLKLKTRNTNKCVLAKGIATNGAIARYERGSWP